MTQDDLGRSTVRWVGGIYVAFILLQRFAVPGLPIGVLLPFVLGAAAWGFLRGLTTFHRGRLVLWLFTAGVTALVIPLQSLVLDRTSVSLGSWGLFMTVWAPFTLQLTDRRLETYLAVLRVVVITSAVLATGCLIMMITQYAGLAYRDYLAAVVPSSWLLDNYAITYPIAYGSPIYRANAWIGLEPSIVSLQMGVGLLAAVLTRARRLVTALLVGGLVAATSGSGFAVAVVGVVVLAGTSARILLRPYLIPTVVGLGFGLSSPVGQSMMQRAASGISDQSFTLRAIEPYLYLWPIWVTDVSKVLIGDGPGSSQRLANQTGQFGLQVPTPIKIFYDYGLLAGAALAVLILVCYAGGHSRSIALALLVSLWALQPGTTSIVVLLPVLVLVTWWSPRPDAMAMEDRFGLPLWERFITPGRTVAEGAGDVTDSERQAVT